MKGLSIGLCLAVTLTILALGRHGAGERTPYWTAFVDSTQYEGTL